MMEQKLTPALAGGVREILRRWGWKLSRAQRGKLGFSLRHVTGGPEICEFIVGERRDDHRSLTPAVSLKVNLHGGRSLEAVERAALGDLGVALRGALESLSPYAPASAREAGVAERHEGESGSDLLLRTTFACNQRCAFCFIPQNGRHAGMTEIARELESQARRAGADGALTISGGEPTVDPRLTSILQTARRSGFRRFVLQTNGVRLSQAKFLDGLISLGVGSYLFSFHSHEPNVYDKITGSRRQYRRAVEGLTRVIRDRRCDVTVNIVVNSENYRGLAQTVRFLAGLCAGLPRRRRPSVYLSMINEAGHVKTPSWGVGLAQALPYLRRAVACCEKAGLRVVRSAGESSFPPCIFPDPARHASQRELPQERVRYATDFSGEVGRVGRAKLPSCRSCAYDRRCTGIAATYARLFGLTALRPVGPPAPHRGGA